MSLSDSHVFNECFLRHHIKTKLKSEFFHKSSHESNAFLYVFFCIFFIVEILQNLVHPLNEEINHPIYSNLSLMNSLYYQFLCISHAYKFSQVDLTENNTSRRYLFIKKIDCVLPWNLFNLFLKLLHFRKCLTMGMLKIKLQLQEFY